MKPSIGREKSMARLPHDVAPGTGFLAGCGDTVPCGTPVENLKAVVSGLERHAPGLLPTVPWPGLPNILKKTVEMDRRKFPENFY
jgi:hypothetical protein